MRVFYGGRISLTIGLMTTLVALGIGVGYGAIAGFTGGRTDGFMMRFVDILYSLPLLFFIIILVTVFGRNIFLIFVAIGAVEWLTLSRIVRGQTLSVKAKEYVESAVAIGLSKPAILRRYIIPNVVGPVVVYVTLLIPTNILIESYLSFIGLGVQEPLDELGPADLAGGRPAGYGALADPVSGDDAGDHDVLLQLHRRRAARRPRPLAPLAPSRDTAAGNSRPERALRRWRRRADRRPRAFP